VNVGCVQLVEAGGDSPNEGRGLRVEQAPELMQRLKRRCVRDEVRQARLLVQVLVGEVEGVHAVFGQPRQEDGSGHPRQPGGRSRGEATQFVELGRRGPPQGGPCRLGRFLQRLQGVVGDADRDFAHGTFWV
jgi:hypothetical protein